LPQSRLIVASKIGTGALFEGSVVEDTRANGPDPRTDKNSFPWIAQMGVARRAPNEKISAA
jgi:hypothetical protein